MLPGATRFAFGGAVAAATTAYVHDRREKQSRRVTAPKERVARRVVACLRNAFINAPPSYCCGIVAYVGPQNVEPILTEGIRILQNRGYDSCGIATVNVQGDILTTKFASRGTPCDSIDLLADAAPKVHKGHRIGIAHTRWATHGAKTDENAHPHSDYKGRISLVHNGTIDNYLPLKERLERQHNIPFASETDTEVISNLIGWNLDRGLDIRAAVEATCTELQGTWGIAVIHKDHPDQIVLARHGSPLLVGCSQREVFVASEMAALSNHTNHFMALRDGEICLLKPGGIEHLSQTRLPEKIHMESVETSPAPFKHWTIKEICEQPQSLARALNYGGRVSSVGHRVRLGGLDGRKDHMLEIRHLILAGCGTSLYAAMYGERLLHYLGCFDTVITRDASELTGDCLPRSDGGLLLLSQSGETLDTIRACQIAEKTNVHRFSVVNVVGSLLARLTNCGVYLNAGREVAVASTKAFTSQVTVLALIGAWYSQHRNCGDDKVLALTEAIHRLPVYAGMTLGCRDQVRALAQRLKDTTTLFVLGRGFAFPVALEAALKIKEISYVHAEGFAGGALKHGPFALIDASDKTHVLLIALSDEHLPFMRNAAEQVKARGAYTVGIVDDPTALNGIADHVVVVPNLGPLTALLATIALQLLAYELAVARNINPDKPRGLAKTVTVS